MKTPEDNPTTFTFHSHRPKDEKPWRIANVAFSPVLRQDKTVPPALNCEMFARRLQAAVGTVQIEMRERFGHYPHGNYPNETGCKIGWNVVHPVFLKTIGK